ncbi:MAG: preprotein translocase subunit YajC [Treponema sp.]|nr:preprotein translocase subunit YajC [Treponema sp.]
MLFLNFLDTAAPAGDPSGQMPSFLIMVLAMIAIFYFLIFRPQKKQENEAKKMLDALKKGDKILTYGGMYGVVSSIKDNSIVVKVDENAKIEFTKTAIAKVVNEEEEKAKAEAAKAKETSKKK